MAKLNSKSGKPKNLLKKEIEFEEKCKDLEIHLPTFLTDYFIFLNGSVSLSTRYAYLKDINFFFSFLIKTDFFEKNYVKAKEISIEDINTLRSRDLNFFIGSYCRKYIFEKDDEKIIYENNNRSLARKKSSLSSLFKFLFRNDQISENIASGLNPLTLPKLNPDTIKRLSISETNDLIHIVETGDGLTDKEKIFWQKTKLRDKAIILLFVLLGLRISELQQLNISSFNWKKREFLIYRKRGKETLMPLNETLENNIKNYINEERKNYLKNDNEDALFLSIQGRRVTNRQIRELIKKYTAIAMGTTQDKGYSPHKLRATLATSLIENGVSIYDVQALLDHENVTTTQIYAAHKKDVKKDILSKIDYLKIDE